MTLQKLLKTIDVACFDDAVVEGISDDSRKVKQNWLFVCRRKTKKKQDLYQKEAQAKGAFVISETPIAGSYRIQDVEAALPLLLKAYYGEHCFDRTIIGVTGTNGKTSVTMILHHFLKRLHRESMVIGTGHVYCFKRAWKIDHTTPSMCDLAYYLAYAAKYHIPYVIMEVSSHAIDQQRIALLHFDAILYTNIAQDHFDYHLTKTHYAYTKFKLRNYVKRHGCIVLQSDDYMLHKLYELSNHKIITVGTRHAHHMIEEMQLYPSHSTFYLQDVLYETQLIGKHNVYNMAMVLALLQHMGYDREQLRSLCPYIAGAKGRMEVHAIHDRFVWIDYAHTESALIELLEFADHVKKKRIISVLGCGGERDRNKRHKMAKVAQKYCDICIFTADNPRNESLQRILLDMYQQSNRKTKIIENRGCAIKYAMKISMPHDIIVIAGKGEEEVQIIKGVKYPFSDLQHIKELEDSTIWK